MKGIQKDFEITLFKRDLENLVKGKAIKVKKAGVTISIWLILPAFMLVERGDSEVMLVSRRYKND